MDLEKYLITEESVGSTIKQSIDYTKSFAKSYLPFMAPGIAILIIRMAINGISAGIKKLRESKRKRDQEKANDLKRKLYDEHFKEYLQYVANIRTKIPENVIAEERKLRNYEFNSAAKAISNIFRKSKKVYITDDIYVDFSKDPRAMNPSLVFNTNEYGISDFLTISNYDILNILVYDGDRSVFIDFDFSKEVSNWEYFQNMDQNRLSEYLKPYWIECERIWNNIYKVLGSLNHKTIATQQLLDWDKYRASGEIYLRHSEKFGEICCDCGFMTFGDFCSSKGIAKFE